MAQYPLPEKRVASLRPAQAKDVSGISALGTQVFASTFGYSMPASDLETYLNSAYSSSSIAADLANPDTTTIIACNNLDSVIGFVQLTEGTTEVCLKGTEKLVELQRLYVSQEYHGEGIGRKLVDCVEGLARERGFVSMWLGVWEENFKAQKVYERMGFRKVGQHDFKMGNCVQTDWILTKRL